MNRKSSTGCGICPPARARWPAVSASTRSRCAACSGCHSAGGQHGQGACSSPACRPPHLTDHRYPDHRGCRVGAAAGCARTSASSVARTSSGGPDDVGVGVLQTEVVLDALLARPADLGEHRVGEGTDRRRTAPPATEPSRADRAGRSAAAAPASARRIRLARRCGVRCSRRPVGPLDPARTAPRNQRIGVVVVVPQQRQGPARPQHPGHLRQRPGRVEPVKGLADQRPRRRWRRAAGWTPRCPQRRRPRESRDAVRRASPASGSTATTCTARREQRSGQFAGAGAQVEDPWTHRPGGPHRWPLAGYSGRSRA